MDEGTLNELLHENQREFYQIRVGEKFDIDLPKIPMTGDTEFVTLRLDSEQSDCVEEFTGGDIGEGLLSPTKISGRGVKAGKKSYTVRLINGLTQQEIENVRPLEINLRVEDI